jgi:hypothetical protein
VHYNSLQRALYQIKEAKWRHRTSLCLYVSPKASYGLRLKMLFQGWCTFMEHFLMSTSVVGWATVLKSGRTWVRLPTTLLFLFHLRNSTYTFFDKMTSRISTGNLPGAKIYSQNGIVQRFRRLGYHQNRRTHMSPTLIFYLLLQGTPNNTNMYGNPMFLWCYVKR